MTQSFRATWAPPCGETAGRGRCRSNKAWRLRCASQGNCTRGRPQHSGHRSDPVYPPTLPLSRHDRRTEAAGRIGAGARYRSFSPHHDRIERGEDRRREATDSPETQKDGEQSDHRERRDHFAQKGRRERDAWARRRSPRIPRFSPSSPTREEAATPRPRRSAGPRCIRGSFVGRASPSGGTRA